MELIKLVKYIIISASAVLVANNSYAEVFSGASQQKYKSETSLYEKRNQEENIYVAHNNSVQQIFYVLGGLLHKPVIVSTLATQKRITGDFNLTNPWKVVSSISDKLGLIWYFDGSSIYIYDAEEIKSKVIKLSYAPFIRLLSYLKSTGLYDARFPLRSGEFAGSFYVSGPPVYVDLVSAASKFIDSTYSKPNSGIVTVRVINLENTFVNDRNYMQRGTSVTIRGIASVLKELLTEKSKGGYSVEVKKSLMQDSKNTDAEKGFDMPFFPDSVSAFSSNPSDSNSESVPLRIIAYSDTNSLLIQGTERQVDFVADIVRAIDVPKKQIQLSLWIIDVSKNDVNELGIQWQGAATLGNTGITLNTSTLAPGSSSRFLADVTALAKKGNAQVVSRPEVLTKENIPALFDNNSSFYSKLIGDHAVSLQTITYGTMISVLPRLAQDGKDIDMILNIQDGEIPTNVKGDPVYVDNLPAVNNTQISTEAQVPAGFSLLVGGYSRIQDDFHNLGIPLLRDIPLVGKLFDYSYSSHKNMVRLFLIQPQILSQGETWRNKMDNDSEVLGKTLNGKDITLRSTVSMLRNYMKRQ
ncbi:TPA: EscC/YscC/HrcC family type III secretion system outer membrane ring protein [Escherichia coli]|nr:EscC/YscC/HrcC family type III secretion system outer membrane ring protein [Escherichia coli]HBA9522828.1 EscC/YscC/HrcC family type III secretion system outer membrane ring protein [Escherichia coli]HBA9550886.1 EscC/YscC/HrcC family type III secretion system outer membrane ring protein [Escherichia coli]HBA9560262.1 EscC/YscC/HrcC family type III secretion system outer membrane ring protein [Escherichia coli]